MWEVILKILVISIVGIVSILVLSSLLSSINNASESLFIEHIRITGAAILLLVSFSLVVLNLSLTRHPFYEYWLIIGAGVIVGIIYIY